MSSFTLTGAYYKITKHPGDNLDYKIDWAAWLAGDTISTSTWTVDTGLTKGTDTKTTNSTTIWLSGGTDGTTYSVSNTIVTAQARTEVKTFLVKVTVKDAGT